MQTPLTPKDAFLLVGVLAIPGIGRFASFWTGFPAETR